MNFNSVAAENSIIYSASEYISLTKWKYELALKEAIKYQLKAVACCIKVTKRI